MSASTQQLPEAATRFRVIGCACIGIGVLVIIAWLSGLIPGTNRSHDPNAKGITGLSADDLLRSLAERGFAVEKDSRSNKALCKRDRYTLEVAGLAGGVTSVVVSIEADAAAGENSYAFDDRKLMGFIASTHFDGANRSENTHWAELHFDDPAQRIDGQILLETRKDATKRILVIRPADQSTPALPN